MRNLFAKRAFALCALSLLGCGSEPTVEEKLEAQRQQILAEGAGKAIAEYERKEKLFARTLATDPPAGMAACKAAIGELMSQSPSIISGKQLSNGRYEVTYRRPSDGDRWSYRCRTTANELMWSTFEQGKQGPWRGAEEIRFRVSGDRLILTLRDLNGEDYEAVFTYPKLKKID